MVDLSSSHPAVANVPATVTIPAGEIVVLFTVDASPVTTAHYGGGFRHPRRGDPNGHSDGDTCLQQLIEEKEILSILTGDAGTK